MPDFKCHSAPKLEPKSEEDPYLCDGPDDTCTYHSVSPVKMNFDLKCKCGLNAEGKSYCPRTYKKSYTENLATVIETFGQLCHTLDRFDIYKCYLR